MAGGTSLAHAGRLTADQLASTLRLAPFDRHRYAVDRDGVGGGNDLVDAMRFAARVELRAGNLVPEPCDRAPAHIMGRRAADDGSTVIGFIAHRDDFLRHFRLRNS